jgi:hypothetical protein
MTSMLQIRELVAEAEIKLEMLALPLDVCMHAVARGNSAVEHTLVAVLQTVEDLASFPDNHEKQLVQRVRLGWAGRGKAGRAGWVLAPAPAPVNGETCSDHLPGSHTRQTANVPPIQCACMTHEPCVPMGTRSSHARPLSLTPAPSRPHAGPG